MGVEVPMLSLVPSKMRFDELVRTPDAERYGMLLEASPEMVRLVVDAEPKNPVPETESAVEDAYWSCEVEEAKSPVRNQLGVVVAFVEVPKVVSKLQSHGRVSVMVPPRATSPPPVRPLPAVTVTEEAERRLVPMVVVETTLPVSSVARSAEVREVRYVVSETVRREVEACSKSAVDEAKREKAEPFSWSAVVVDWTAWP